MFARMRKPSTAWAISIGVTVLCLMLIVLWIYRSYATPPATRAGHTQLTTPAAVAAFKVSYDQFAADAGWNEPIYIPTGMFVQSIEFTGPYNVRATGYIWQRYPVAENLPQGVVLPEAERQDLTEVYRVQQGDEELVGWYFVVNVREPFDYRRYPFDRQDVRFRIWYKDFEANVELIPDLAAYTDVTPVRNPGIDEDFILEGWDVKETFFSVKDIDYNSNFGFQSWSEAGIDRELFFNVSIERDVMTPLLTQGVSPTVVFFLVFVTFLFFSKDHERRGVFGLSWNGVIGLLSGSFFATLVAQAGLRNQIKSDGFVFLESLHILLYPTILAVAIITTLMVAAPDRKAVHQADGLLPRLLYWPLIGLALLLVTMVLF
jgi:hypothetical protein